MYLKSEFGKIFVPFKKSGNLQVDLFKVEEGKLYSVFKDQGDDSTFALNAGMVELFSQDCLISVSDLPDQDLSTMLSMNGIQYLLPVHSRDNLLYLTVFSQLDDQNETILSALAAVVGYWIENHELSDTLKRTTKLSRRMISEMTALHEISRAIDSSQNIDSLLKYILEKSMYLIEAESASLMLIADDNPKEMEFKVALGPKSVEVKKFRLPLGKGIAGWVAQHGEPILIPDAYSDPRFDPSFDKRSGYHTKSYLCVPLKYKKEILGAMTVLNRLDDKAFDENDQEILATFASQAALAIQNAYLLLAVIEKERLEKELQVASEIQKLLIPQEIPQIKGMDISAVYIPCKEVSGDFYDVIPVDEHRFIFVVADVAGKGIPGALLVSNMQAWLRAYVEYNNDLVSIISRLNERIIANTTDDRYITFFFGLYDDRTSKLSYVNAGHNPPVVINKSGEIELLKTGGIFLGYIPWRYEMDEITLKPGDAVVMYTDGLVEAMNRKDEEFGEERLKVLLKEIRTEKAGPIRQMIITEVDRFRGNRLLEDDFTLIVARRV